MAKVAFTSQAINDIREIAAYIGADSQHYASLQVAKIFSKIEILETHKLAGRQVPELRMRSIREILEGNYRIVYRIIDKDSIHILTIHHSKRQMKQAYLKRLMKRKK